MIFAVKPATKVIESLEAVLIALHDKSVEQFTGAVRELVSDKFLLISSSAPAFESTSLQGLFADLQNHLQSQGLRCTPLAANYVSVRQRTECVLNGWAVVGFEIDDLSLRSQLSSRIIVELWEGGCRTLILQTGSDLSTTIDLSKGGAGPRGVIELRDFLTNQLALFREDPILLLKSHLGSPARISSILGVQVTPCFLDRARFLSQLMEAEGRFHGRVFNQTSYAELVVKLRDTKKEGPAYMLLRQFSTCAVELEWGEAGIDRITLLSPNNLMQLMPWWFPMRAISSVAIPEAMRTDPREMHRFLSKLLMAVARSSDAYPTLRPRGAFLRHLLQDFLGVGAKNK